MKHLFYNVFNKHLCAFVYTLFFFCGFTFNAEAQICPTGLTVSIKFDIENQAITTPIPFCTPIIVTTTVKNATDASQTTDLRTAFRYGYEVVCLNDYATAIDCSDANVIAYCLNNVSIPANGEREFRITVRYNTQRISFGVNFAIWNIYENYIDVQNAQGGMQFNSGTGATVTHNIIDLRTASHSNANGIQAGGSTNFNVSCNDIAYLGNPNPFFRSAIFVSSGTGSSYTCNNVGSTEFGLNIVGDCRPFSMSGNNFNRHFSGLRVNDASIIGVQSLRGNTWQGPFTTFGAENLNQIPNDIAQSRFFVGSPNAPIMPTFSPPLSGWFQVVNGTDATCTSLNACSIGTSANRVAASSSSDESFYTSAISEERMQTTKCRRNEVDSTT